MLYFPWGGRAESLKIALVSPVLYLEKQYFKGLKERAMSALDKRPFIWSGIGDRLVTFLIPSLNNMDISSDQFCFNIVWNKNGGGTSRGRCSHPSLTLVSLRIIISIISLSYADCDCLPILPSDLSLFVVGRKVNFLKNNEGAGIIEFCLSPKLTTNDLVHSTETQLTSSYGACCSRHHRITRWTSGDTTWANCI